MSAVVQNTKATNGLAQTFNNTYSSGPTEGNLLVALIWHDEAGTDIAALTSSGWTRMGTVAALLGAVTYRMSVWAKFAGAAESTTVAWDLGEVNRRSHGYAVEFSGVDMDAIPGTDSAAFVSGVNQPGGTTSNQVDNPIDIGIGQFGLAMVGLSSTSASAPTWASEVTPIDNWSINFRGSGIGFFDPPGEDLQPTATWGSSRPNIQGVFVIGEALVPVTFKRHSSFQIIKA